MKRQILQSVMVSAGTGLVLVASGCTPAITPKVSKLELPSQFAGSAGTEPVSIMKWREFFTDPHLRELIETALGNNQELQIAIQEIEIAKNEVTARSGAYLPFLNLGTKAGLDKSGRYTRDGAVDRGLEIKPGKEFPDPLSDFGLGARASWEVDIWHRLRDAEKSAVNSFFASTEGKQFLVTNIIGEIASSYYELLALDSQLVLIGQNVEIQSKALNTVRAEKIGARVTELAVQRFEAQLAKTKSLQFEIQQKIVQAENKIHFLVGCFPKPIIRSADPLIAIQPPVISAAIPSQMVQQRPDIKEAEWRLKAADLDVQVARAAFYPSLNLSGEIGLRAYDLGTVLQTPASLLYALTADVAGPLINRRAITADYLNANAKQISAVFSYERAVLNGFIEVSNQVAAITNTGQAFNLKSEQVRSLAGAVDVAGTLFLAARADYGEVLLTQREALEARFELIETKLRQMQAVVGLYRSLGGGWA